MRKARDGHPIRLLFGLGFDVATEIGLLVPAGRAAASYLLFSTVLLLVVLFAAGMCLMAIGGGAFMNLAYRWGHTVPVRKVFYNLVVTALAVAVAAADSSGHARHIKRDMTTPQIIHRHQGHGQQPGLAAPDGPKPARPWRSEAKPRWESAESAGCFCRQER